MKVNSYDSLPIDKFLILDNVTILLQSVLNKDKNHYYPKIFLEKCSYQLAKKNNRNIFFHSITLLRFGETKIAKKHFIHKPINIWDINVDNIVISKLIKIKTNSKYLVGIFR